MNKRLYSTPRVKEISCNYEQSLLYSGNADGQDLGNPVPFGGDYSDLFD